jgi:serine protease inhibitor
MPWPFRQKSVATVSDVIEETSPSPHTRFAFKLFRELSEAAERPNLFLSPSSVMLCLALVCELASGETRQSMARTLEIAGLDRAKIESEITLLNAAFRERPDAAVTCANSLWLGQHVQIATEVENRLCALYQSELKAIDFSTGQAVATINAWVADKTKGKITQIVDRFSPLTALVAMNAVYFKGVWKDPFRKELTRDGPFHTASGQTKQLPMMAQSGTYSYLEDRQVQVVTLPYRGGVSMHVMLPVAGTDVGLVRKSLSSGQWESWAAKLKREEGVIKLPRFKVDYAAPLRNALTALGMGRAFDQNQAEFAQVYADRPPVWLDMVIHRALAEVNEEGTEAAAATVAHMLCGSAMPQKPPRLFQMIVDRPFFIAIRDETTKTIQFMGWIGDPQ